MEGHGGMRQPSCVQECEAKRILEQAWHLALFYLPTSYLGRSRYGRTISLYPSGHSVACVLLLAAGSTPNQHSSIPRTFVPKSSSVQGHEPEGRPLFLVLHFLAGSRAVLLGLHYIPGQREIALWVLFQNRLLRKIQLPGHGRVSRPW